MNGTPTGSTGAMASERRTAATTPEPRHVDGPDGRDPDLGFDAGPVRVQLTARGPIYVIEIGRRVRGADGDRVVPVYRSAEPSADTPWPESPPWQMVHREIRAGGEALMAIGSTVLAHYSLAITTDFAVEGPGGPPASTDSGASGGDFPVVVRFEYACRYREHPEFVGETLSLVGEGGDGSHAAFRLASLPGTRPVEPGPPVRIEAIPPTGRPPGTVTFGFSLQVASDRGEL